MRFFDRLNRYIVHHIRYTPIRVFCLHHISDEYDPVVCSRSDWISTSDFKSVVGQLQKTYSFISLSEAYHRIKRDWFRLKKYAVLTFDDGYKSPLNSLQWLEEKQIPYTLFLNAKYLDGKTVSSHILRRFEDTTTFLSEREIADSIYLKSSDLYSLSETFSSFGSHGYEHLDATQIPLDAFRIQIEKNHNELKEFKQFILFHAYTWGRHSVKTDNVLHDVGFIPVLMDGGKNYNDTRFIHREPFPSLDEHSLPMLY